VLPSSDRECNEIAVFVLLRHCNTGAGFVVLRTTACWNLQQYVCVCVLGSPVLADYEGKCSTGTPITLTADTGYIVNHVAFNPSTLHAVCTWRIRVAPGQRIALTLYDFGRHRARPATAATAAGGPETEAASPRASPRSSPRVSSATVCRKYAVVRDTGKIMD